MQLIVDGLYINYQRQGKGKKVILLHGWADSSKGMQPIFNKLSKKFDVLAIDLPGFGASQRPKTDWGLNDYANFVAELVKKLKINDIYSIVGHSNGGAIAIKALANSYISTEKLILISSSGIRNKQKGKLNLLKAATKTAKVISLPLAASTKRKLRKRLYDKVHSDLLVAEDMSGSFKKIITEDIQSDATEINIPTLLIYGQEDNQTPVLYGEIYHQLIKNSTLEIIGGAGHFIQYDQPDKLILMIEKFL